MYDCLKRLGLSSARGEEALCCFVLGADHREGQTLAKSAAVFTPFVSGPPHVAFAFNAGMWGYDSWAESVRAVLRTGCPFVITSYNEMEAEDDQEVLETWRDQTDGDHGCNASPERLLSFVESHFTSKAEYEAWAL
ncbi:MAG: hypothetical protein SGPRY_014728, partial [Prymnesium sp.]